VRLVGLASFFEDFAENGVLTFAFGTVQTRKML
jgi:hypothetical protein